MQNSFTPLAIMEIEKDSSRICHLSPHRGPRRAASCSMGWSGGRAAFTLQENQQPPL